MSRRLQRIFVFVLCSLFLIPAYSADIECVGKATQVVEGNDTMFIFRDEPALRSNIGAVDWYTFDGTLYASGMEEIFPEDGCYRVNNIHFCVQTYKGIDDLDFTIEATCENTLLHVTGDISSRAHTYSLSYNALAWNTEEWAGGCFFSAR